MSDHAPAIFIADSRGLDFLNSVATPVDTEIDWIADSEGFLDWLAQAKFVAPDVLDGIKARATPGELDRVAGEARQLREWCRGFVRKHMGKPLPPNSLRELDPLNALLSNDEAFSRILRHQGQADRPFQLQASRRWRSARSLLLPIGEALAKFICEENFSDVKACEGTSCTLMFADHTRRRDRRWCSMAICGNRAKQAAHRERLKHKS
ncbi:ABATE domain-containing protein [Bradyrhizobium sp.]|uniref:CGNR zinc finger domain-containing protein n=1 Tax=Bradyrhizobium sp. TaxID=376 RepID=UPI002384F097|nr:ABATE domain-containing protein [Bradyrhizobium sp.]MDE1936923.1 CGNR zinc finger domain-containing protein [Bradyrhizobium sp.]